MKALYLLVVVVDIELRFGLLRLELDSGDAS